MVLAAGHGTRMRSRTPKVLHPVAGRPMVTCVLDALAEAGFADIVVVADAASGEVARAVDGRARIAVQSGARGTAEAVLASKSATTEAARLLIVNGDLPLLEGATIAELAAYHVASSATLSLLTAVVSEPAGYGRVVRDMPGPGRVRAVIEQSEVSDATAHIDEVNVGLYAVESAWLWTAIEGLPLREGGERYLTDIVATALEQGQRVATHTCEDAAEAQQVNTRVDLARAEAVARRRILERVMLGGVTMIDPDHTYIDAGVEVGEDTVLLPGVHLVGGTRVGSGCRIGPDTMLRDMLVGDGCTIGPSTLEGSTLEPGVDIGPYCRIRPGSRLESGVHLGNFAEVKASRIGAGTAIGHFSYIGDSDIGSGVNIGAGTITVNYDGKAKYRTVVGDDAFIGSDSLLIAPIEVGPRSSTAAGSVVTRDVPADTQVLGMPARPRPSTNGAREATEEAAGPTGA